MSRSREEVLNVALAQALTDRAAAAVPESIEYLSTGKRALPDVMLTVSGMRCCIEGKVDDVAGAHDVVLNDARNRLDSGICQIAVAAVYPSRLRGTRHKIADADIDFRLLTESGDTGWLQGDVDSILAELRRSYDLIVSDDIVSRSVDLINDGMAPVVSLITANDAAAERLAALLGVYEPTKSEDEA